MSATDGRLELEVKISALASGDAFHARSKLERDAMQFAERAVIEAMEETCAAAGKLAGAAFAKKLLEDPDVQKRVEAQAMASFQTAFLVAFRAALTPSEKP